MSVYYFIKHKVFSKKFSRKELYLLGGLLFILVIGILLSIVTTVTIQKNSTQAKAEANFGSEPKFDPMVVSQSLLAGLDKKVVYTVSYDPKLETAEVVEANYILADTIFFSGQSSEDSPDSYSFKVKFKNTNNEIVQDSTVRYKKADLKKDNKTGKVTFTVVVPDNQELKLEFTDLRGKSLINKHFSELPKPTFGIGKNK